MSDGDKVIRFPGRRDPDSDVQRCRHGVPLDLDCAECHGIKREDQGEDTPAA